MNTPGTGSQSSLAGDAASRAIGKPVEHYVLFGPAAQPATRAYLLLAQSFLQAFAPAFGFSPAEAGTASEVTIIAGSSLVSADTEAALLAGGARVQRIAGSPEAVAAALEQKVACGKAF
jgi:hypothetical protein